MTAGPSYVLPETVLRREVDGETVLLDLKTERYFGLDAIGTDMVNTLTLHSWDHAIATLCGRYDVDPQVLMGDLDRLVTALLDAGLLRQVGPR